MTRVPRGSSRIISRRLVCVTHVPHGSSRIISCVFATEPLLQFSHCNNSCVAGSGSLRVVARAAEVPRRCSLSSSHSSRRAAASKGAAIATSPMAARSSMEAIGLCRRCRDVHGRQRLDLLVPSPSLHLTVRPVSATCVLPLITSSPPLPGRKDFCNIIFVTKMFLQQEICCEKFRGKSSVAKTKILLQKKFYNKTFVAKKTATSPMLQRFLQHDVSPLLLQER